MSETCVEVVTAEALRVGPRDVLIVQLDLDKYESEYAEKIHDAVLEALVAVGLQDRAVVMTGGKDDVKLTVIEQVDRVEQLPLGVPLAEGTP